MQYDSGGGHGLSWLTRPGQDIVAAVEAGTRTAPPKGFRLASAASRRPDGTAAVGGFKDPGDVFLYGRSDQQAMPRLDRSGARRHTLTPVPATASPVRPPPRPRSSQSFASEALGTFKPSNSQKKGDSTLLGLSRRHVKSLPDFPTRSGWKQMFDHKTLSYYWLNTRDHTSQWHHPHEAKPDTQVAWEEFAKKAAVQVRKDKAGVMIGDADSFLPEYPAASPQKTGAGRGQPAALQTRQAVLAMLNRWANKWDKISEAFRGLDIKDGVISRSQLRTALIRFNVSYNDALLETVWSFLDPSDIGSIPLQTLAEFVLKNEPMSYTRTGVHPAQATPQSVGSGSQDNADMQAQIQARNAAAERNEFARTLMLNMATLRLALSQSGQGGKVNRMGLTAALARAGLTPKNADLVGEYDDFLVELKGDGGYSMDDINVQTIRAFAGARSYAAPTRNAIKQKKMIWNPVDGGSKPDPVNTLPPTFRAHIQLIRDTLFSRFQMPSSVFLYLDKEKKGTITHDEFRRAILAMELYVPVQAIDYLWLKLDKNGEGFITYSNLVEFFDNVSSKDQKRAGVLHRSKGMVSDTTGVRVPLYVATRGKLSGRVQHVKMTAPPKGMTQKQAIRVPLQSEDKNLHTRSEYLGIYPENSELKKAVQLFGNTTDHGAKDIFRI